MGTVPRRGLMFVLSSPSGAGKTTLSRRLVERYVASQTSLVMSVSVTTRPPRPGEVDGKDYFFIERETFDRYVRDNALLEHAQVFDYCYGTPAKFVHEQMENGVDVLFDIDWQGTRQLAASSREDLVSIFILPPSMEELERRLKTRAQDSNEVVMLRMAKAAAEISHWGEYDYVLINTSIDETLDRIDTILKAERLKRRRQSGLTDFIRKLA
jgi:guanylate kinase